MCADECVPDDQSIALAEGIFEADGEVGHRGQDTGTQVAVETIYAGFGSKKVLLGAAMDVAIVGDAGPVALFDRPEALRIHHLPVEERLTAAITLVGHVYSGPVAGVWSAMLEAAARDSDVAGWCDLHEQRRHETLVRVLEMCGAARPAPPVLDAMWAVGSMEVFAKLTRQRGGTVQQWVGWIVDTFRTLVSRPIRLVTGPTPNILAEVTRQ